MAATLNIIHAMSTEKESKIWFLMILWRLEFRFPRRIARIWREFLAAQPVPTALPLVTEIALKTAK